MSKFPKLIMLSLCYFYAFWFLFLAFSKLAYTEEISSEDNQKLFTKFNFDIDYQGIEEKSDNEIDKKDPLEGINRKIFVFNETIDKNIVLPVARKYQKYIPSPVRSSVNNFVENLSTPFSIINSAIQGDGENSMASFSSFLINTTVGVGGLFDVAGSKKIKYRKEDFGQTLGKYGVEAGPYIVIPLFGPSDLRDFSGLTIEKLIDPLSINVFNIGNQSMEVTAPLSALEALNTREKLVEVVDDLRKNSFDLYSTIRSAYLQRRQFLIKNKL